MSARFLRRWLAAANGKPLKPSREPLDEFALKPDDPLLAEHELISRLLVDCLETRRHDSTGTTTGAQMLELGKPERVRLVMALHARITDLYRRKEIHARENREGEYSYGAYAAADIDHVFLERMTTVMRQKLPFTAEQAVTLLNWWIAADGCGIGWYPLNGIVTAMEALPEQALVTERVRKSLRLAVEKLLSPELTDTAFRKHAARLKSLLGAEHSIPLTPGEPWSDEAIASIERCDPATRAAWIEVLNYCHAVGSGQPSAKWFKAAQTLVETKLGHEEYARQMLAWLPYCAAPRTQLKGYQAQHAELYRWMMIHTNQDVLKGLILICGLFAGLGLERALAEVSIAGYGKNRGSVRSVKMGNAGVAALGMLGGSAALGQLAVIKGRVKFGTAQIAIAKALNAAAPREGTPPEELEELSVPAYGLTEVGRMVETLGEFAAELVVTGSKTAEIVWRRADGKVQKSLPAAVKKEFAEQLKELNATKKDIEKMLPAQAERIDSLFLQQKSWALETWLERYLEHPLVGTLARRLIWNFDTGGTVTPGLWLNGKLVDRLGHPVSLDAARTRVSLWHPLDQSPDVVLGWRGFLEEWLVQQPFKQAHREVYLLTPAEERTRTYSNRFASHILKQHQFNALCAARGWKNKLRLQVDAEYPPATRMLPQWALRAEFWIEGAGDEINDTGTFLYLTTDQVRFYRIDDEQLTAHAGGGGYNAGWQRPITTEPVPLADIPPLVFSEIMRDLFVGVASVGNDPAWADGGRRENEREAWNHFSFGELSATAHTRRDLLQRLVPKLKIASRCSFADKFLVVRGDLRTYKIHLGSGNILMAPNDRYLCIMPGSSKAEDGKVFLPFEGDRTLSVILSKAFLLADDTAITDPSITRQLAL